MNIRHKFSPRIAVIAPEGGESRTQQHFAEQCNINSILKKYQKTGVISHVKSVEARYGDFSQMPDYCENLDKVAKAQQGFEQLPSAIRNHPGIKNSLGSFMEFMKDPQNADQLRKWGIFKEAPKEPTVEKPSEPATPPAPEPEAPKKVKKS